MANKQTDSDRIKKQTHLFVCANVLAQPSTQSQPWECCSGSVLEAVTPISSTNAAGLLRTKYTKQTRFLVGPGIPLSTQHAKSTNT